MASHIVYHIGYTMFMVLWDMFQSSSVGSIVFLVSELEVIRLSSAQSRLHPEVFLLQSDHFDTFVKTPQVCQYRGKQANLHTPKSCSHVLSIMV